MDDAVPKLTVDDFIAFGRDYERLVTAGTGGHLPRPLLDHFLAAAVEALMQQKAHKQPRGGRPRGSGMGEMVIRLVANGALEANALNIAAQHYGKSLDKVRRAHSRASKKPTG